MSVKVCTSRVAVDSIVISVFISRGFNILMLFIKEHQAHCFFVRVIIKLLNSDMFEFYVWPPYTPTVFCDIDPRH
jgi:hypothetical protein